MYGFDEKLGGVSILKPQITDFHLSDFLSFSPPKKYASDFGSVVPHAGFEEAGNRPAAQADAPFFEHFLNYLASVFSVCVAYRDPEFVALDMLMLK
jgi:hypothetical protein